MVQWKCSAILRYATEEPAKGASIPTGFETGWREGCIGSSIPGWPTSAPRGAAATPPSLVAQSYTGVTSGVSQHRPAWT
jgi:hypothetical protein